MSPVLVYNILHLCVQVKVYPVCINFSWDMPVLYIAVIITPRRLLLPAEGGDVYYFGAELVSTIMR